MTPRRVGVSASMLRPLAACALLAALALPSSVVAQRGSGTAEPSAPSPEAPAGEGGAPMGVEATGAGRHESETAERTGGGAVEAAERAAPTDETLAADATDAPAGEAGGRRVERREGGDAHRRPARLGRGGPLASARAQPDRPLRDGRPGVADIVEPRSFPAPCGRLGDRPAARVRRLRARRRPPGSRSSRSSTTWSGAFSSSRRTARASSSAPTSTASSRWR